MAGEEPCVVRRTSLARRSIPGDDSAAKLGIANPRLVHRNLRPGQRAIDLNIRRFDLQCMLLQFELMRSGRFLEISCRMYQPASDLREALGFKDSSGAHLGGNLPLR